MNSTDKAYITVAVIGAAIFVGAILAIPLGIVLIAAIAKYLGV